MSPTHGTFEVTLVSDDVIMPPITTVLPLATFTDASARVMSLMGEVTDAPPGTARMVTPPLVSYSLFSA